MNQGFCDLPIDLLAYCLSHVAISDIRSCWSVCKNFARAIVEKKHFWKRHVANYIKALALPSVVITGIDLFDTFDSPRKESLQEQVQFLFKKDRTYWFKIRLNKFRNASVVCVYRQTGNGRVFGMVNVVRGTNVETEEWTSFDSPVGRFDAEHGERITKGKHGTFVYLKNETRVHKKLKR